MGTQQIQPATGSIVPSHLLSEFSCKDPCLIPLSIGMNPFPLQLALIVLIGGVAEFRPQAQTHQVGHWYGACLCWEPLLLGTEPHIPNEIRHKPSRAGMESGTNHHERGWNPAQNVEHGRGRIRHKRMGSERGRVRNNGMGDKLARV